MAAKFKITYATLAADNEELQSSFDRALETVRSEWLGADVPMWIDGERVYTDVKLASHSPINTEMLLCTGQQGDASHTDRAVAAASGLFRRGAPRHGPSASPSSAGSPIRSATTSTS